MFLNGLPGNLPVQKGLLNSPLHLRGRGERREGRSILEMGVHHEGPDYRPHLWWHQGLVSSRFEKLPFNDEKLFLMSKSFFLMMTNYIR